MIDLTKGEGRSLYIAVLSLLFASRGATAAASTPSFAAQVERWGIEEISLHSNQVYGNPFKDVQLEARFVCSGRDFMHPFHGHAKRPNMTIQTGRSG
jgi:hypothetical protein